MSPRSRNADRGSGSADEAVAYLTDVLVMNPLHDAQRIVARRAAHLGLRRACPEQEATEQARRREAARRQIEWLRNEFWSLPIGELKEQLDTIDVDAFPELQAAIGRLRRVSVYRGEFPKLASHRGTDAGLFNAFKRVVVLPPREAGELKERFLRRAAGAESLKPLKRTVRMMQKEFPRLYELESDWLGQVARLKRRRRVAEASGYESGDSEFAIPGWLIVLIIIIVSRVLVYAIR